MTEYKTAAELRITDLEYQALLKTMEVLAAEQQALNFDMSICCCVRQRDGTYRSVVPDGVPTCGTNACIGGTMGLLLQCGMELPEVVTRDLVKGVEKFMVERGSFLIPDDNPPFSSLFYDNLSPMTTPQEGIGAIQEFLRGNTKDCWGELANDD